MGSGLSPALFMQAVGLREQPEQLFDVAGLLPQRPRIPFAAVGAKEIAAVNVDGAGQPRDGIGDRMDDVRPQRLGILFAQGAGTRGLDLPAGASLMRRQKILSSRPV